MIKKFLQEKVRLHKKVKWRLNKYYGLEEFVLKHGIQFGKSIPLPDGVKKGKMKLCHYNSYQAALDNDWLFYVEGYVLTGKLPMPTLHAWTTNKKLEVIDPTWGEKKAEYYGVIIKIDYVLKWAIKNSGNRILIDDSENGYLLMREDKADWVETNFKNKLGV